MTEGGDDEALVRAWAVGLRAGLRASEEALLRHDGGDGALRRPAGPARAPAVIGAVVP
jgi:hypothetical protein